MMYVFNLILVLSTIAAYVDNPPSESDQGKLEGTWVVEKQDWGKWGNLVKDTLLQVIRLDIKGDTCTMISRESSTDPEERNKLIISIDNNLVPHHIDFAIDGKEPHIKAIYRFDKKGSLTIAVGLRDNGRPKGFDPSKESIYVLVLQKKKEEKK
jgi:uncharacterized protein (TIGR03067 family)